MGLSSSSLALVDSVVVIVVLVLEAGRRNLLLEEPPPSVLRGGSVVARTRSPWTVESDELSFLSLKVGGVYLLAPLILDEGLARVRAGAPSSPSSSWEFSTFRPCFSCLGLNRSRPTKRDERVLFRDGILTLDLV